MVKVVCRGCHSEIETFKDLAKFLVWRDKVNFCPHCQRLIPRETKKDKWAWGSV